MDNPRSPRRFKGRAFVSLLLALSFLVMGVTGTILYLSPKGRVAHWTNWTMLGLEKEQWSAIHITNSLVFFAVGCVHLYLNWRLLWGYVKNKAVAGGRLKWELPAAVAVAGAVVLGTYFHAPPFSTIIRWNDQLKMYWARNAPRAPVPHAEELSLEEFAGYIGLPPADLAGALRREGFSVEDGSVKIRELAAQKGIAPSDVHAVIQKHFPEVRRTTGRRRTTSQTRRAGRPHDQPPR